ncbi:hypothetical protein [Nocardia gamkensis]|uniref:hypothetical protein n=1 Tax=Nocardia gamkensis TaxID=352869 RepID=UPI0037C7A57D
MDWNGTHVLKAVTEQPISPPEGVCQFPGCHTPLPARAPGQRGAPRRYCGNPDHTAQKALRHARNRHREATRLDLHRPSPRPVTDGKATLSALLDRYAQLRAELGTVAADVTDLFTHLTDPAAIDREIADIRQEATRRVTAAENARAAAEQHNRALTRRLEQAVAREQRALAAADEADARTRQARTRLEQAETDAAARIASAEAERDRAYTEAETTLGEMRDNLDAARIAQARAEGERDILHDQREALREDRHLRERLDTERIEHRRRIEHRDIEYARAITVAHAMASHAAREHREQLTEVIRRYAPQPTHRRARATDESDAARSRCVDA